MDTKIEELKGYAQRVAKIENQLFDSDFKGVSLSELMHKRDILNACISEIVLELLGYEQIENEWGLSKWIKK